DRREGEALLGRDDDRARDGRERPRVLALAVVRHEFVDLPADHGPLVRRLALADPALERIPVEAGARRLGLLALRLVVAVGAAGITEDLELHEAIDVLGRKSGLIELDAELLDAPRRYRDHGYVRVPDRQVPVNRGVFGLSPPVGAGPGRNTTDRRSPRGLDVYFCGHERRVREACDGGDAVDAELVTLLHQHRDEIRRHFDVVVESLQRQMATPEELRGLR